MSKKDDWPSYYDIDWVDSLDEAKKKYFKSEKGKAALRRYFQSDKGKAAFQRHYQKKRKPEKELVEVCKGWLKQHPGKTIEDFLREVSSDSPPKG